MIGAYKVLILILDLIKIQLPVPLIQAVDLLPGFLLSTFVRWILVVTEVVMVLDQVDVRKLSLS